MGLNFDETDVSPGSENCSGMMMVFGEFSQHCDALLHGNACKEQGFEVIPNEFRVLEQKGYYVPNFYMVKPLKYVGIEKTPIMCKDGVYVGTVKDGAIFIIVPDNEENLDDLSVRIAKEHDPDIIESLPVVLFRRCHKPIGLSGKVCNDWSEDWSERLHCKNDTSEFIGVFKAQRKGESGDNNVYKMTKIFNRYYFDTSKIQIEIAE